MHNNNNISSVLLLLLLVLVELFIFSTSAAVIPLTNWKLQSSSTLSGATGAQISTSSYNDSDWYAVRVPCTVLDGLVQNGVYKSIYYGENLMSIDSSLFVNYTWWYRTHIQLTDVTPSQRVRLFFKGINYRASIWVNGRNIATEKTVVGSFRYFDFDVTNVLSFTSLNYIAVEITCPHNSVTDASTTDLAITFVDWSPPPPDSNMGLWREVELITTLDVTVGYPMVQTKLSTTYFAHLTIVAELENWADQVRDCKVTASIEGLGSVSQNVTLQPNQITDVIFTNSSYPVLNVANPSLWWPWQMGSQPLYSLRIEVTYASTGVLSDTLNATFGIRESTSELTEGGNFRLYRINGNPILIRGAGWSPDLLLRSYPDWQEQHFKYMMDMNLNTVRLEGKMEDDHFMELADRYGILVMPGWCCCDSWQHWDKWKDEQYLVASESQITQAKRLRIHPSVFVFVYSSDELPPVSVEKNYLTALQQSKWPNPFLAAASDRTSTITGPTGVKMSGPYSWEPPNYWLLDTSQVGGAFGFLTEGGPGGNPLSLQSLSVTIPSTKLWPINDYWNFHCGADFGNFGNLRFFTPPLMARYGTSNSAKDYLEKSQVAAYEGHRAMFEGYGRNKYTSTGVIQWMLNNPFPEMIWHLYDYYFSASSTYFATKRSCEAIHPQYSYDDNSVWIVNSLYTTQQGISLKAEIYSITSSLLYAQSTTVSQIEADSSTRVFTLPISTTLSGNLTGTFFVRLSLSQPSASYNTVNFYWLSTTPDVLDWSQSNWYQTPCTSYADLTLLQTLPPVQLVVESTITADTTSEGGGRHSGDPRSVNCLRWNPTKSFFDACSRTMVDDAAVGLSTATVKVTNPAAVIAFFVEIRLVDAMSGTDVLGPIVWEDNFFSLLPGETRTITGHFTTSQQVKVVVDLWNNISGGH